MATMRKSKGKTPNGGDYSEIYFFDDAGNPADEKEATNFIVRECKKDGQLINEIHGRK